MNSLQQMKRENHYDLKEPTKHKKQSGAMKSLGTNTDIKGLVHAHVPSFTSSHPAIPKHYIMPWKQDMSNRKLILKHANLAGVYSGPQEESLFLENKERLYHGEKPQIIMEKVKIPSEMLITGFPMHSHLSRYQSYIISQKRRMLGS